MYYSQLSKTTWIVTLQSSITIPSVICMFKNISLKHTCILLESGDHTLSRLDQSFFCWQMFYNYLFVETTLLAM